MTSRRRSLLHAPDPSRRAAVAEFVAMRKRWNMSEADLAALIGIGVRTLQYWETGARVTAEELVLWADALGCNVRLTLEIRG